VIESRPAKAGEGGGRRIVDDGKESPEQIRTERRGARVHKGVFCARGEAWAQICAESF